MIEPRAYDELWRGTAHIGEVFERSGVATDVPMSTFLHNAGRVIVRNDPAIAEAFGEAALLKYERTIEEVE